MREIRFRVWHTTKCICGLCDGNGFMEVPPDEDTNSNFVICGNGKVLYVEENIKLDESIVRGVDSLQNIILQGTGLRDKNGKEIYEGDIINFYFGDTIGFSVIWDDYGAGKWSLEYCFGDTNLIDIQDKEVDFSKTFQMSVCSLFQSTARSLFFDGNTRQQCCVIGNIHENPELTNGGGG